MKQTAVKWLIEKFNQCEPMYSGIQSNAQKEYLEILIEQAKEKEKQQIIDAFGVGCHVESTRLIHYDDMAEQYYNETYKNYKK
jgi:hypothetical protein